MAGRIATYIGGIVAVLLLAVAVGFALLQTGAGKNWLATKIAGALADPGEQASVGGVTGFVPFDFRIGVLSIGDAAGPRLTINDLHVQLGLDALLARRLSLTLAAARITVARPSTAVTGPTDWSQLLHPPLGLDLARLDIGSLELGAPVLGTALTVAVTGSGAVGSGTAVADLAVERRDGTPGALRLHLAYDDASLVLHAVASEPTGTVLAALLHRREPLPFELALDGDGPLESWRGRITAHAGDAAALDAALTIAGAGPYRLSLTATAQARGLLPPAWQPLFGGAVAITAEGAAGADKFILDRFSLTAPFAKIDAAGSYGFAGGGIAGTASVAVADLAPLAPLLGGSIVGQGTTRLTLGGTLAKPTIDATLQFEGLGASAGVAARAQASLSLRPEGDPLTTTSALSASGRIEQLVPATGAIPAGLGDAIDWRITASLDPRREQIVVDALDVTSAGSTLAATATASRDGVSGTARIALPDLARFGDGLPGGALSLAADFRAAADGTGTASLSGAVEQPRTGIPQIDAALGPRVALGGALDRLADGTIESHDIAFEGAAARITGNLRRAGDGKLAIDATLSLPRLATLDARVAGAATATVHLAGPPDALAGTVAIAAPSLGVTGERIEGFTARLALAALTPPAGHLEAQFRARGLDATIAADGAMARDGGWRVTRLVASAGGARVEASATRSNGRLEATLHGTFPDLAPLSRLAGTTLAGRAALDGHLAGEKAELTLDVVGLASPENKLAARHLRLAADLADIFTRPTGHAEATITEASAGGATLSDAKLGATSDRPGHFALTLAARGTVAEAFALAGGASLGIERGTVDLRIDRLGGTLGATKIELAAPLAIAWRDGSGRFANLALRFGPGRVDGEGALARSTISLHLTARDLPLRTLAQLGGLPAAEGELGFELTLAGTRAKPEGRLVIDGEKLRFAAASHPDLAPFGLVASAIWRDGQVSGEGRLAGPQKAAVGWRGSAPLLLAAQGFGLYLPPAGAVSLHLEGDGEVGAIADLLPLGEDRIAGHFAVEFTVAGTVEHPDASGRLTITNGRYDSLAIGSALTGLDFSLVGDRERLVLRDFHAGDGGSGSLRASGAVDLAAWTIDATAELQHFRALRRDEGTAVASGTLKLSGPIDAPRVDATLTVEEAEIAVPERLPQSVRPVDAVIINSRTGANLTPQAPPARPVLLVITLAITVDLPGKVFVRGRGLDGEWRGRVAITGTSRAPILTGRLDLVRGTYDFLSKNLVLTKGTITFYGGRTIDPTIGIEARAQSSDVTAIVGISGTATQPTIKLSSEPDLPRDEILSRLLFGTSMSQISAAQGLQIASAASSLAGGPSLDVLATIRSRLGLDRLSFGAPPGTVVPGLGVPGLSGQPASGPASGLGTSPLATGSSAAGGIGGSALNAGKYVANGVYVGVSQGLGAGSSTVTATVDVTPHITIDTEAGQASGSGVGINWKLDY